jgi:hypothetical protein
MKENGGGRERWMLKYYGSEKRRGTITHWQFAEDGSGIQTRNVQYQTVRYVLTLSPIKKCKLSVSVGKPKMSFKREIEMKAKRRKWDMKKEGGRR